MAKSLATINIGFQADLKQFTSQMDLASKQMKKYGRQMERMGKTLTTSVTAPLTALAGLSVVAWNKQAQAIAQVEAGLRSTGNAVGYTSSQLQEMAAEMQNNSLFGDEAIMEGVTAQLLTFTNIANKEFARTQQAAVDLAARLKIDLKSASIQLGKALNDPIANLSALSRSGIQFTKSQKQMVKSLWEGGKVAEAQSIILQELEKQYGGSARAAAEAGTGGLTQLWNSLGDLAEQFGEIIYDYIRPFIQFLKDLVARFQSLDGTTKRIIVVISALVASIGPLMVLFGALMTTVIPGLITAFTSLTAVLMTNPFGAIAAALGLAIGALTTWNSVLGHAVTATQKEQAELNGLVGAIQGANDNTEIRAALINKLQQNYPNFLGNLDKEKVTNNELSAALKNANQEYERKIILEGQQKQMQEAYARSAEKLNKAANERLKATDLISKAERVYGMEISKNISTAEQLKEALEKINDARAKQGLSNNAAVTGVTGSGGLGATQKEIIAQINALEDAERQYAQVSAEAVKLQRHQANLQSEMGLATEEAEYLNSEIVELAKNTGELNNATAKVEFKGIDPSKLKGIVMPQMDLRQPVDEITSMNMALKGMAVEMQEAGRKAQLLGSEEDALAAKKQYLLQAINNLMNQGYGPMHPMIQQLAAQFRNLTEEEQKQISTLENMGIIAGNLSTAFQDFFQGVISGAPNMFESLINHLKQLITKLLAAAAAAAILSALLGGTGSAFSFKSLFGSMTGFKIPAFANGGITSGAQLAMVGDNPSGQELILPSERVGDFMQKYGGTSENFKAQINGTMRLQGDDFISGFRLNDFSNKRWRNING